MLESSTMLRLNFVLDQELYSELENESNRRKITVSKMIAIITNECKYLFESWDFIIDKLNDAYFNEKNLCMSENLRISIDPEFKRKLFMIQDHYQLRSKAEILRFIIRIYFKIIKKYTESAFRKFMKIFIIIWENVKETKRDFIKRDDYMDKKAYPYMTYTYNSKMKLTKITYIGHPKIEDVENKLKMNSYGNADQEVSIWTLLPTNCGESQDLTQRYKALS